MEEYVFLVQCIFLAIYVGYLVWQYSDKHVPNYVKALTFLSWVFTFSAVIVIPVDIANSQREEDPNTMEVTYGYLYILWRVLYWLNFLLSWIILPLCQDFEDSGEFTVKARIRSSIKKNLIIYGTGLALGAIFIFYLAFSKSLSFTAIQGVLGGLGNLVGILLIILLLGYGLVAIPKRYINVNDEEKELYKCYEEAIEVEDYKMEKMYDMEEKCRILGTLHREYANSELGTYIVKIQNKIPQDFWDNIRGTNDKKLIEPYQPLNMDKVANLHREVKRLLFDLRRADTRFSILCETTSRLELLLSMRRNEEQVDSLNSLDSPQFHRRVIHKVMVTWRLHISKPVKKNMGFIFAFLSIVILLGELSIFLDAPINLMKFILNFDIGYYGTQLILIPLILYISACTFYGLFAIKIAGLFAFNRHHQTDAPSLMFGSINFGRVSFPLCYNFLQLTQINITTAFGAVIGDMNIVPIFGPSFSVALPIMLILMCFVNLFNIYGKIMGAVGLGSYAGREEREGMAEEGKRVIQRERESRLRVKEDRGQQEMVSQEGWSKRMVQKQENRDTSGGRFIRNFNDILNI